MDLETRLKQLRLDAPTDGLRRRVFAAIRENRIWRWTVGTAAAVLVVCMSVNASIGSSPNRPRRPVRNLLEERPSLSSRPIPRTLEDLR